MSLTLDYNISQSDNARELTFTEQTGTYNLSTNPGGFGSPNPTTSDALTAVLTITDPDDDSYTLDIFADSFPTTDSTQELNIRTQDLGLGTDEQFTDGKWTFTYTITTATETFTSTQIILLLGQSRCCVFGLLANADVSCCNCGNNSMAKALEAYTWYRLAITAASCGDSNKFTKILDVIDKYCNSECTSCGTCN